MGSTYADATFGVRPPRLDTLLAERMRQAVQDAAATAAASSTKPAPKIGDKVKVTVEGYVRLVNQDGTVSVSRHADDRFRSPMALGRVGAADVTVIAPPKPLPVKVGDTISGQQVKDTPWKRGTVLRHVVSYDIDENLRYVLLGEGIWHALHTGRVISFEQMGTSTRFVVEYAPGKKG